MVLKSKKNLISKCLSRSKEGLREENLRGFKKNPKSTNKKKTKTQFSSFDTKKSSKKQSEDE